jgi:hypothetical protein
LVPINTYKESNFNADFKYISFIKFNPTHKKLCALENLGEFRKKGKDPLIVLYLNENHSIKFSVSENPTVEVSSSYLQNV